MMIRPILFNTDMVWAAGLIQLGSRSLGMGNRI